MMNHLVNILTNNGYSSNMLYPKEDRNNNKLMFACRTCQFSEEAISSCVFRNNLYNTVGETAGVTQDVGSDPTVGFAGFCTLCGEEIKCFQCEGKSSWVGEDMMDDLVEETFTLEDLAIETDNQSTVSESEACIGSKNP